MSAVGSVRRAIDNNKVERYEIIIVDNGSTDGTRELVARLATSDQVVKVVYPPRNLGIGQAVREGVDVATCDYTAYVPGDNEVSFEALNNMFGALGEADVVNTYIANMSVRPLVRRLLSRGFTYVMRLCFGVPLKYFTGPAVVRTDLFRSARRSTDGFAFMAEILVQVLKAGYSFVSVPMPLQRRMYGRSGVYRARDVWRVFASLFSMMHTIYFTDTVSSLKALNASRPGRVVGDEDRSELGPIDGAG